MNIQTFTIAAVTEKNVTPFVFLKYFPNLNDAIAWACNEVAVLKAAKYILIREGDALASDPVVWDSRNQVKQVVYQEDLLEADMKRAMAEVPNPDPGLMIWTHTPLPDCFPIEVVHARFEKRAASVLGDYDCRIDFKVWQPHEKEGYGDYRYKSTTVRAAWMMYLDLALEHFDRFGTVV